jgi:hypothetical protein
MNSRHVVPVVLYMLLGGASGVSAGELGHYAPGLMNIRDFFVPEPGFYYAQYNYFYLLNRSFPFAWAAPAGQTGAARWVASAFDSASRHLRPPDAPVWSCSITWSRFMLPVL